MSNHAEKTLSKEQRILRNEELARKFYDGYVRMSEVGYPDTFKADDWEMGATVYAFDRTAGERGYLDEKRKWKIAYTVDTPRDWKVDNRVEYQAILKILPDWKVVTPFKAFWNEEGFALQMHAGGHTREGKYFECNEIEFAWTNEFGKLTCVEVFNDWVNTAEFLACIAGGSAENIDYANYHKAIEEIAGGKRLQR